MIKRDTGKETAAENAKLEEKRGNGENSYQNDGMKVTLLGEFISIKFCSYIIEA